jgi:hypothetical protein
MKSNQTNSIETCELWSDTVSFRSDWRFERLIMHFISFRVRLQGHQKADEKVTSLPSVSAVNGHEIVHGFYALTWAFESEDWMRDAPTSPHWWPLHNGSSALTNRRDALLTEHRFTIRCQSQHYHEQELCPNDSEELTQRTSIWKVWGIERVIGDESSEAEQRKECNSQILRKEVGSG